jgi:hypothetical protein
MPIAVTCQCGAKLEIDEKFLGKEIQCPDCQRPLPTKAPPKPPPLDLQQYRRTEGLAVLSLTLALTLAFTIVGTLAAIVVGVLALKRIASNPVKLDGARLARAGIVLGAVFTFITLTALISPTVFGLDALLRDLALGSRLDYVLGETIADANDQVKIKRPTRGLRCWAKYNSPSRLTAGIQIDPLILVNTRDDTYIACQDTEIPGLDGVDEELVLKKVLERLQKSELINLLNRPGRVPPPEFSVVEKKNAAENKHELILDIRLGGVDRRLLVQYRTPRLNQIFFAAACARRSRFDLFQEDFREALATFKDNP